MPCCLGLYRASEKKKGVMKARGSPHILDCDKILYKHVQGTRGTKYNIWLVEVPLCKCVLYSRKLFKGENFPNSEVLWLFAKVFSANFGILWRHKRKFSPQKFPAIYY